MHPCLAEGNRLEAATAPGRPTGKHKHLYIDISRRVLDLGVFSQRVSGLGRSSAEGSGFCAFLAEGLGFVFFSSEGLGLLCLLFLALQMGLKMWAWCSTYLNLAPKKDTPLCMSIFTPKYLLGILRVDFCFEKSTV